MYESVSVRVDKEKWDKFVLECRRYKIKIWDALEPLLKDYNPKNE